MRYSKLFSALALASAVQSPLVAHADGAGWSQRTMLNTVVWEHSFDRVTVTALDCSVSVKLHFIAPKEGYKAAGSARNHYYFHARLKFADGKKIDTGMFKTSKPGAKLYSYDHDTSSDGCWAKGQHKLSSVDVVGCRGQRCPVPDFE
jgi:hypothetical protein